MTYSEKLKDPRWQKKRLEVLQRDEFTCLFCGDTKSTLHVHHAIYFKGLNPWEYDDSELITLCESCHEFEHEMKKDYTQLERYLYSCLVERDRDMTVEFRKNLITVCRNIKNSKEKYF